MSIDFYDKTTQVLQVGYRQISMKYLEQRTSQAVFVVLVLLMCLAGCNNRENTCDLICDILRGCSQSSAPYWKGFVELTCSVDRDMVVCGNGIDKYYDLAAAEREGQAACLFYTTMETGDLIARQGADWSYSIALGENRLCGTMDYILQGDKGKMCGAQYCAGVHCADCQDIFTAITKSCQFKPH
jgi:hypothetical protein